MADALYELYAHLVRSPKRQTVRELDADARRVYMARIAKDYRQRHREAKLKGSAVADRGDSP